MKQKLCKQCWKEFYQFSTTQNMCSQKCKDKYDKEKEKNKKKIEREKKKVSVSALTKKADKIFSEYIRTRDNLKTSGTLEKGVCITCWETSHSIQCWHFITRARKSVRWNEYNANGQCPWCNCWWWWRQYEHWLAIDNKYWLWTAETILKISNSDFKLTREYLESIIKEFSEKLDKLKSSV